MMQQQPWSQPWAPQPASTLASTLGSAASNVGTATLGPAYDASADPTRRVLLQSYAPAATAVPAAAVMLEHDLKCRCLAPPPPPFQPPMMHQNQFPLPVQSEAPIMPQPFPVDNNNNVNAINENVMKPWYMSGDDQRWQQTWVNSNKADTPFNPNPAAATSPFVDNTAVVEQQPVVPQPAPEQPMGHDSDGIDGFPREEKFKSLTLPSTAVTSRTLDVGPRRRLLRLRRCPQRVNAWQRIPTRKPLKGLMPAAVPAIADPSNGPVGDKDFLPLRISDEVADHPQSDADTV
ncbi:hypothetical protein COOONC_28476 [Cooperia oncophora]